VGEKFTGKKRRGRRGREEEGRRGGSQQNKGKAHGLEF
jgi:hypothetical protein